jgi:hypothetical protein
VELQKTKNAMERYGSSRKTEGMQQATKHKAMERGKDIMERAIRIIYKKNTIVWDVMPCSLVDVYKCKKISNEGEGMSKHCFLPVFGLLTFRA